MYSQILSYTAALYAASYFSSFLSIGLIAILARKLSAEALGEYAFYSIVFSLGQVILSFGLHRTLIKYLAEGKENKTALYTLYFWFSIGLMLVTTLASAVSIIFASATVILAIATIGPSVCIGLTTSVLRADKEKSKEVAVVLASSILVFVSTLTLLIFFPKLDYLIPILGTTIGYLILSAAVLWYFHKFLISPHSGSLNITDLYNLARRLSSFSFPVWTSSIGSHANEKIDQFAVRYFIGFGALGEYYLAIRFFEFLEKPITILSKVLMATFSTPEGKSIEVYKKIVSLSHAIFPFFALVTVAATPILVPLLYTSKFLSVSIIFSVMSIAFAFKGIETVNGIVTITQNHPYINQRSQFTALPLNTLGLYFLVQALSVMGAATAKGFTRGVYAYLHTCFMRKVMPEEARFSLVICTKALLLYLAVLGLMLWARHPVVWISGPILYLLVGQWLRIWNLRGIFLVLRHTIADSKGIKTKSQQIEPDEDNVPCLRDVEQLVPLQSEARIMVVDNQSCGLHGRVYIMSRNDSGWPTIIPTNEASVFVISDNSSSGTEPRFDMVNNQTVDCIVVNNIEDWPWGKNKSQLYDSCILNMLKKSLRPGGYLFVRIDAPHGRVRSYLSYSTLRKHIKHSGFSRISSYICTPTFNNPKYIISMHDKEAFKFYLSGKKLLPGKMRFGSVLERTLSSVFPPGWIMANKVLIAQNSMLANNA